MKSARQRKKTLDQIYGSKFSANPKPTPHAVPKNRESEPTKIEHRCDKTGMLITLSSPQQQSQQQTNNMAKINLASKRGNLTYRINPTLTKRSAIASGPNNEANKLSSANNMAQSYLNLDDLANHQLLQKLQNADSSVYKPKKARSKARSFRGRKANLEKLFQCLNMESCHDESLDKNPADSTSKQPFNNVNEEMYSMTKKIFEKSQQAQMQGNMQQHNIYQSSMPQHQLPPNLMLKNPQKQLHVQFEKPGDEQVQNRVEELDNETAEFVNYVRRAVEEGVQNALGDILDANYNMMAAQIESFALELKKVHALLHKVQDDLDKKIVHYGEETSRHFRYLCMKSEYDKLFYQHNVMVAFGTKPPVNDNFMVTKTNSGGDMPSHTIPVNHIPNQHFNAQTVPTNDQFSSMNQFPTPLMNTNNNNNGSNSNNFNLNIMNNNSTDTKNSSSNTDNKATGDAPRNFETNYSEPMHLNGQASHQEINQMDIDGVNRLESFCKRLKEEDNQLELCMKPPSGTLYNSDELMIINKEVGEEDDMESCVSSEAFTVTSKGHMAKYENEAMMASSNRMYLNAAAKLPDN